MVDFRHSDNPIPPRDVDWASHGVTENETMNDAVEQEKEWWVLHAWKMEEKTTKTFTRCGAPGPIHIFRHIDTHRDRKCPKCVKLIQKDSNLEKPEESRDDRKKDMGL